MKIAIIILISFLVLGLLVLGVMALVSYLINEMDQNQCKSHREHYESFYDE